LFSIGLAALGVLLVAPASAAAEKKTDVHCTMSFTLKGWSAFYKTAKGEGTVTCDNGQSAEVKLKATGGGLTVGKSEILHGKGNFSVVKDIGEVFGAYVTSEAHAGAVTSVDAQAMTKGEVSLALTGVGRGFDIGIAFGKFEIKRK
jgi:hypothetical protein